MTDLTRPAKARHEIEGGAGLILKVALVLIRHHRWGDFHAKDWLDASGRCSDDAQLERSVMGKGLRWLHLSDLHAGMKEHGWLWPTFKNYFLDDLKRLHERTGSWDVVIFSGDLSQRGEKSEYEQVTQAFQDIWAVQAELGFTPVLVAIPGNHDLVRPSSIDPAALVLKDWWNKEAVHEALLAGSDGAYKQLLSTAFSGYSEWKSSAKQSGIPLGEESEGLFPGDFSSTIITESGTLGIVGLNSSWLQLDGGDYKGRLSVEVQQLLAVTNNDPDRWCRSNTKNILVTHHPTDWLHPRALDLWRSEINPTGRFDAHLYGHMHDPDVTSVSSGGSRPRRSIQAASLFGLEKTGSHSTRINGYSVAEFNVEGTLRVWPRIAQKLQSGSWKLVADQSLDVDDDGSFSIEAGSAPQPKNLTVAPGQQSAAVAIGALSEQRESAEKALQSIRYYIPGRLAHRNVRKIEQHRASSALSEMRAIWLSAEWGAGSDGFIKSIIGQEDLPRPIYKLDLADYTSREEYLDGVKASMGVSFELLCAELAGEGPAYLILDNCPTSTGRVHSGRLSPESDVEQVVGAILSFCPDLRIFLRSRRGPEHPSYTFVPLAPLDEADVRAYVLDHEKGGAQYSDTDDVSAIYRHTDGVPARIDTTLRDLEIMSIEQLSSTNSDLVRVDANADDVPASLRRAIDDLSASKDPDRQRGYALLRALVAFPHGETIVRLRRFYGAQAIYPGHAREVIDSSMVTSATPIGVRVGGQGESEKLLIVPRPVRDYVRSTLTAREHGRLTKAAASVYFGENWMSGGLKSSVADKFARPSVPAHEVANANSIILRLLNEALDAQDERGIDAALGVAKPYIAALYRGDHFRNVVSLARDLLARIPEDRDEVRAFLTYEMGRALRMVGRIGEAGEALSTVDSTQLPPSLKRSLMLSQALNLQSKGDSEGAVDLAKKILKADRKSSSGLQAKAILLEENPETTDEQLRALERTCRRSSATVVANNLALGRASRKTTGREEANTALDDIINAKGSQDFYNRVRAIVKKIRLRLVSNEEVSEGDKALLIDAYHFLYNERLPGLFDLCQDVLWDLFVREGDQENLLRLFRHSSLIWRLRGEEAEEGRYLKKLAQHVQSIVLRDFRLLNKETAYYLVRASAVLS